MRQWDLRTDSCPALMRLQQPVSAIASCSTRHLLAVGDELGSLTMFDMRKTDVQLACLLKLHHDVIRCIAFPPQGDLPRRT